MTLAHYATQAQNGANREHPEGPNPLRAAFDVDRARVIACTAFRRLLHKTQVFAPAFRDHFRTRLTHTIEVAQIARTLATNIHANAELADAITLAHDLGHPPFGHAGEKALAVLMAGHGGFNHNTHSLRVVEYLEHPFPAFRGLNLTRETRAGLATHETRYDKPEARAVGNGPRGLRADNASIASSCASTRAPGPAVEAQIASLADRVAYNIHDLEDAIGAEFITLEDLGALPILRDALSQACDRFAAESVHAIRRPLLDALLDSLLLDAVRTSHALLANIRSPADAALAIHPLIGLSETAEQRLRELEEFLLARVYRQAEIARMDAEGQRMIRELFAAYLADPSMLPPRFASRLGDQGAHQVICDYVAGMTDRFCAKEHARVCERAA